jgi:MFS family permease
MPTPTRRRPYPTFRGWWIVAVSFLALFLHGAATSYLFGILAPFMEEDLGWSRSTLAGALTVAVVASAAAGVPLGPWVDRRGSRAVMAVSAVVGGLMLVGLGLVSSVWAYYLLLGVGVGVARAGLENVGPRTAIANWFVRRRAAAFAWFSGGRALFGFAMVPVFAWIATTWSWRSGWMALGIAELVLLAPLAWFIVRRRPEDAGGRPDGDAEGMPTPPPARFAPTGEDWTRREAARTRAFWLLVVGFTLTGFPATGIIANMVLYFRDYGMSPGLAALGFSTYGLGAMFGRPTWGYLSARFGVHRGLTAWGFAYGTVITLFTIASTPATLFPGALFLGLVIGGVQQLQAQAWPDYYGRKHVGAITGLTILLLTPALATGPLLAALGFDLLGSYTVVFAVYGAISYVSGVCFLLARRPVRSAPQA